MAGIGSVQLAPRAALTISFVVAATLCCQILHAQVNSPCSFSLDKPTRLRDDRFTLSITNGPKDTASATVKFLPGDGLISHPSVPTESLAVTYDAASSTIVGGVPDDILLGTYDLDVRIGGAKCVATDGSQRLRVQLPGNPKPHLNRFSPEYSDVRQYVYPATSGSAPKAAPIRVTKLQLRGSGFQVQHPADNVVFINSARQTFAPGDCTTPPTDADSSPLPIIGQVISDQAIDLCQVPVTGSGKFVVYVSVGEQLSEQQTFGVFNFGRTFVGLVSGTVALVLALLPLYLLHWLKGSYAISREAYKLRLLFLDPQTDTYSLSNLQFYLWTVAALFSYSYLFISFVFIQHLGWPDIPGNLPGVIGLAAGTSVGAQIVTASRGSKGAGEVKPGFADFITSGGVVAPDRVQMLLWTVFGVGAFVVVTLSYVPATITDLPTVPDRLLYLMGLSSAGYLGGKLARKPGPVISEISVSPTDPDELIIAGASPLDSATPDFTDALAKVTPPPDGTSTTNSHAKAVLTDLSNAVSAVRSTQSSANYSELLAKLGSLVAHAEQEATQLAGDYENLPDLAAQSALTQSVVAALQDLSADATLSISRCAGSQLQESLEGPHIARTITIRGTNLSAQGLFQIDHVDLPFRMLLDSAGAQMPDVVIRDETTPTFARILRLSIDPAHLGESDLEQFRTWFGTKGNRLFTLTNPDGQMAQITLPLPPGAAEKSGTVA